MGVHHPYRLDLCADDEDPSQLIIRLGWDAPHVRCFPRTFCAWPCLLRQVGTVLGSPYDYVVAGLTYTNPGSRQSCWKSGAYGFVIYHGGTDMCVVLGFGRKRPDLKQYCISGLTTWYQSLTDH